MIEPGLSAAEAQARLAADGPNELPRAGTRSALKIIGEVLREDFGPESDVNVCVRFEESAPWSLWDIVEMKFELEELFGRPVDLLEADAIRDPFRRREIESTRRLVYADTKINKTSLPPGRKA